jgi:hypothetical protein
MSFREDKNDLGRWVLGMAFFRTYLSIYDLSEGRHRIGLVGGRLASTTRVVSKRLLEFDYEYGYWWILVLVTMFFSLGLVCCCFVFRACCAEEKKIRTANNMPDRKVVIKTPIQPSPVKRRSIPYIE